MQIRATPCGPREPTNNVLPKRRPDGRSHALAPRAGWLSWTPQSARAVAAEGVAVHSMGVARIHAQTGIAPCLANVLDRLPKPPLQL